MACNYLFQQRENAMLKAEKRFNIECKSLNDSIAYELEHEFEGRKTYVLRPKPKRFFPYVEITEHPNGLWTWFLERGRVHASAYIEDKWHTTKEKAHERAMQVANKLFGYENVFGL